MITVFLDESGDLGFDIRRGATSRHFLVTALICSDVKPVDKAVKKIFAGFSKTEVRNHHGFLHSFREKPETREKLLKYIAGLDVGIEVVVLDKRRIFTDLADEPHVLYASIVNVLMNRLLAHPGVAGDANIHLVASQRETQRLLNSSFVGYLSEHIAAPPGVTVAIEIKHASAHKGLQAADMVSWSMFRELEHHDPTYAQIVRERVWEIGDIFG